MSFKTLLKRLCYLFFPPLEKYHRFLKSQSNRISFMWWCKFWLNNKKSVYWPVHKNSEVTHPNNIFVGINSNAATRPGCYLQGNGGIRIGNYVHIASNVGVISGNHNLYNHLLHDNKEVRIDDYCWIGMNSVILPGVHLGPRTIVGAGSIVTKSFPEGFCVICGNPAKKIKLLDKDRFLPTQYSEEFFGFVQKRDFRLFAQKHLRKNIYYELILDEIVDQ